MKPYSWKDIESVLKKELKKTKHIMTFGTIGSKNVEHDIDVIITKKPSSPSSGFYGEIHGLFDSVDNYLNRRYGARAVRFALSTDEVFIRELGGPGNKVLFHTMIYTSFPQIEKDWAWGIFPDENMKDLLRENYTCFLGSVKDLFKKEFLKPKYYDSIFIYLYQYDKTNANLSNRILMDLMNSAFDYLLRKRLGVKANIVKTKGQAREEIYRLCDILDRLEKE